MITIDGYIYFRLVAIAVAVVDGFFRVYEQFFYIVMHRCVYLYIRPVIDTGCAIDIVSLTCRRLHVLCQCKIEWRAILFLVIYHIDSALLLSTHSLLLRFLSLSAYLVSLSFFPSIFTYHSRNSTSNKRHLLIFMCTICVRACVFVQKTITIILSLACTQTDFS